MTIRNMLDLNQTNKCVIIVCSIELNMICTVKNIIQNEGGKYANACNFAMNE